MTLLLLLFLVVLSAAIYFGGQIDLSFLEKEAHSFWLKRGKSSKSKTDEGRRRAHSSRQDNGGEGEMILLTSEGVSSSRPVWKYPLSIWIRDDAITGVRLDGVNKLYGKRI